MRLYAYYAVEVTPSSFWGASGENLRVLCGSDPSHVLSTTANFCEICGSKAARDPEKNSVRGASEPFRHFCAQSNIPPEEAFALLTQELWEWSNEDGSKKLNLGLHSVQALKNASEPQTVDQAWALGAKLCEQGLLTTLQDQTKLSSTFGVPFEDLALASEALGEVITALELKAQPKLYFQVVL